MNYMCMYLYVSIVSNFCDEIKIKYKKKNLVSHQFGWDTAEATSTTISPTAIDLMFRCSEPSKFCSRLYARALITRHVITRLNSGKTVTKLLLRSNSFR